MNDYDTHVVVEHNGIPDTETCSECRNPDYPIGTRLTDVDGDGWTKTSGQLWQCDLVGYGPWNYDELLVMAGPLTVEEPSECTCPTIPGLAGESIKVATFDTVCAYCRGDWTTPLPLVKPLPIVPTIFTAKVSKETVDKAKFSSGSAFPTDAFDVYEEAYNVLLKKNADYGPSNIADSPGGPLNGILVRMWDKMSRLRHLVESGVEPENESLRDTLMDMANYSLIAMIVLDGNWPGMETDD